ncbi:MAG: hypothetical protein WAV27_07075 [Xanthobacteraceae bacterium]
MSAANSCNVRRTVVVAAELVSVLCAATMKSSVVKYKRPQRRMNAAPERQSRCATSEVVKDVNAIVVSVKEQAGSRIGAWEEYS